MRLFLTLVLVQVLGWGGCTHAGKAPLDKPYRVGVIAMSPELSSVKPLAEADFTGWLQTSGVLVGSVDNDWVMGVSLATKETLWWVSSKSSLAAPISVVDEWVILGFRDGTYMKVDSRTGNKQWEITLDSFSSRRAVLANGLLLVLTTSQQLYAIDFESGTTKWLYDGGYPDGLHMSGAADPASDGQTVLVGLASGELHGVDLQSGRLLWRHEGEFTEQRFHDVMGTIAVRGNSVVFSRYDGVVQSLDYKGAVRQTQWSINVSAVTASIARGERYYIGCLNGDLHAIDIETGKKLWTAPTGQTITSITPGEETIYLGGANGRINAVNALNGELRWHDDLNAELHTPPVIVDGNIYFATGYKNLYGYRIF